MDQKAKMNPTDANGLPQEEGRIVFACIAPHGSEIIAELSPKDPERMAKTRAAMLQLGEGMRRASPESIVVLTPHGIRVDGRFAVSDSEWLEGRMGEESLGDGSFRMARRVDRELARAVASEAESRRIPAVSVNFAVQQGPLSRLPMDWGAMVPLYFMPDVPVVSVTSSRALPYAEHLRFGQSLSAAVRDSGKRVGLIASCDWSHTHAESGPYGFDPAAAELDRRVVEGVQAGNLEDLMEFSDDFVQRAKPDGIWQALILAGAVPRESRRMEFLSYEAPTYFGLLCASLL